MQNEMTTGVSGAICELVREMYQFNPVGGPLHIVLDDGNTDDESIRFCLATSRHHWSVTEDNDNGPAIVDLTATLGHLLLRLTEDERDRLYKNRWGR